jgi:nucleoside-diphosphate-sugar epimerase
MKKKILITGGSGYIAKSITTSLCNEYDITSISRSDFDLTNREDTNNYFKDKYFDYIIHTAIKGGSRLIEDSLDITHTNLSMFYNLLNNKNHFKGLINLGSGAELGLPTSPYGLSKNIIYKLTLQYPYFHNIRIFGIFDENELDTRFIKSNIKKYLNNQPIEIHQDKQMDFFYMEDFIQVLRYFLNKNIGADGPPKELNCSYKNHYTLSQIADIINSLDKHKVPINIHSSELTPSYVGDYNTPYIDSTSSPSIEYIGLEQGIKNIYNKLKDEY